MKKYLQLFIALILISSATAYPCIRHTFKETGTENPVTNVKWEVYACGDSACTTINPTYWYQSGNSGTNKFADIKFKPALPPSGWYLVNLFHDNYIAKYYRWNVYWSSKTNPDLCDRNPPWETPPLSHFYFNKKANCKAPASLTVQNKIGEWLPLTIDTTSQLDADTASAFESNTNTYYPPDEIFKKYQEIATTITLQIKDKTNNAVVKTASQNLNIYSGTSKTASFSWTPSEPSYKAGKYIVTLTSHVTDPKCSSVIDDVKTQEIEVFPELPNDACVITADPTKLRSPISRGQQGLLDIPSYYYHMIKTYDASYNLHLTYKGVTANYKLIFTNKTNKVDKTLTGNFPKSFTDTRTDVAPTKPTNTVVWTPLSSGNYNVRLELTSTDALCAGKANDFSRGTRTDTVTVLAKDADGDGYNDDVDCNDNNPAIHPGATDTCDGKPSTNEATNIRMDVAEIRVFVVGLIRGRSTSANEVLRTARNTLTLPSPKGRGGNHHDEKSSQLG